MVPRLDAIRGGGGSVRIGATGTVSSLMSRELDSVKRSQQPPKPSLRKSPTIPVSVPCVSRLKMQPETTETVMSRELDSVKQSQQSPKSSLRKSPTVPVSVPCVSRFKRQPETTIVNEASTSGSSSNHRSPGSTRKTRSGIPKKTHSIPMLGSDNTVVDNSPNREKTDKKGSYIVEVVDLKCGSHDKGWSNPITHQLRKLSFSKLSERIG